jgi:hypothetical protein
VAVGPSDDIYREVVHKSWHYLFQILEGVVALVPVLLLQVTPYPLDGVEFAVELGEEVDPVSTTLDNTCQPLFLPCEITEGREYALEATAPEG